MHAECCTQQWSTINIIFLGFEDCPFKDITPIDNTTNNILNGFDYIIGGEGNDTIYGNNGYNTLEGNEGNDVIYGGDHYDIIAGGTGNNKLYGGKGNNTYIYAGGNDTIYLDNDLPTNTSFMGREDDFDDIPPFLRNRDDF